MGRHSHYDAVHKRRPAVSDSLTARDCLKLGEYWKRKKGPQDSSISRRKQNQAKALAVERRIRWQQRHPRKHAAIMRAHRMRMKKRVQATPVNDSQPER